MAFHTMFDYTAARAVQDMAIDKLGAVCTIFTPKRSADMQMQGYENEYDFTQAPSKCFIDFPVKRRVFYHFNWFPENEDQIVMAYFTLATEIAVDQFIRTTVIEQVSPYGDLLFRVVKIGDDGKYKALKRTVFLSANVDRIMYEKLVVA